MPGILSWQLVALLNDFAFPSVPTPTDGVLHSVNAVNVSIEGVVSSSSLIFFQI